MIFWGPPGSLRTDGGKSSTMIFVKSAMAGIAAVFLSCLVLFVCVVGYLSLASKPYSGPAQWDPVSVNRPFFWLVALAIFLAGFFWEFRRSNSK
jgi:hypothetical protein